VPTPGIAPAPAPGRAISLTTNIADVVPGGVPPRKVSAFRKLGIRCVADLLTHLPMRYEHELPEQTIAEASNTVGATHSADANLAVRGEVATVKASLGRKSPFIATLHDGTGTIKLTWFNAAWMRHKLHPGMRILAWGKAKRWGDYLDMVNPKWREIEERTPGARDERYVPVYPATESLPSELIEKAVQAVLDDALKLVSDHLPEEYRRKAALPGLADAYRMMHRPRNEDEIAQGRRRLAFDELLMLQLGVMMKRKHRRGVLHAPGLRHTQKINEHIRARLPFEFTPGQKTVIKEIVSDLQREVPMNRLLQGDVGSGKTVVALYAMLLAVASGGKHQAALMAPTELLAEQHFASIARLLRGSRVKIELLTGSLKPAHRKSIHKRLEDGDIDILIGTHALLSGGVNFKSLAVAVIDEQHRFGVHQRAQLRAKASDAKSSPHILVMTATPIPRTMSLTVFGDLDISTIEGMPPGRKPIITRHVPPTKAGDVYAYVSKQLASGGQAYIVVPVIDESQAALKSVREHMQFLAKGPLAGKRLAAMHGRLDREEREEIMQRFRMGKIDALVATTVIEVGVDVPNASIMVIEHAEMFGLAQLHQLRGRVGRGERKSVCVLIADPQTDDAIARIEAIVSTTDGFKIAEKDLEIRGPGELFGARQSGLAPFKVVEFPRDLKLLQMARRDAGKWIEQNPYLAGQRDALLRKRLLKLHGEALGLGDVA